MIGPFMKVFGSKWSAARAGRYPVPLHDAIFEMFAGGAGYACAHHEKRVTINEAHPELNELWQWLVNTATEPAIREIPIFAPGQDISQAGLCRGQALLVKWWQRTNNHGTKTWIASPWSNKPGQWTPSTRARIAEQVSTIKHWKVLDIDERLYFAIPRTIFVDPVYEFNHKYGFKTEPGYYDRLGGALLEMERFGHQIIACEALGPNGERPTYLPFVESHSQVTSRRKSDQSHHSKELIYITGPTTDPYHNHRRR